MCFFGYNNTSKYGNQIKLKCVYYSPCCWQQFVRLHKWCKNKPMTKGFGSKVQKMLP